MSDILPVSTGVGFGNGFGADALGAFGGALIGSWFGVETGAIVVSMMLLQLAFQLRF